jgi:hypothetical protein
MQAKAKTIGDFKLHESDTGSADVQPRRGDQVFVIAEAEVLQVA